MRARCRLRRLHVSLHTNSCDPTRLRSPTCPHLIPPHTPVPRMLRRTSCLRWAATLRWCCSRTSRQPTQSPSSTSWIPTGGSWVAGVLAQGSARPQGSTSTCVGEQWRWLHPCTCIMMRMRSAELDACMQPQGVCVCARAHVCVCVLCVCVCVCVCSRLAHELLDFVAARVNGLQLHAARGARRGHGCRRARLLLLPSCHWCCCCVGCAALRVGC